MIKIASRKAFVRLGLLMLLLALTTVVCWWVMLRMPGTSHSGPLVPITPAQRELAERLEAHVRILSEQIGSRNFMFRRKYGAAVEYISAELAKTNGSVESHVFEFNLGGSPGSAANLILEIPAVILQMRSS